MRGVRYAAVCALTTLVGALSADCVGWAAAARPADLSARGAILLAVSRADNDVKALVAAARRRPVVPAPAGWQLLEADPAVIAQTGAAAYADEGANAVRLPGAGKVNWRDAATRFMVANEVAHLLDYSPAMTDRDRERFSRILGVRGPWRGGEGDGADRFSDGFAQLVEPNVTGDTSQLGPRRLRRFALSLDRFAHRNDLEALRLPRR